MANPAEKRDVRGNTIKPHSVEAESVSTEDADVEILDASGGGANFYHRVDSEEAVDHNGTIITDPPGRASYAFVIGSADEGYFSDLFMVFNTFGGGDVTVLASVTQESPADRTYSRGSGDTIEMAYGDSGDSEADVVVKHWSGDWP